MIVPKPLRACAFVALLGAAGCDSDSQTPQPGRTAPPGELITSQKTRVQSPQVSASDSAALVAGNTDFGVAVYRQVTQPGENALFSPLSITQAFGMLYAGARGNTATQMEQALKFSLPAERLHPALNWLSLSLQAQDHRDFGDKGKGPTFRTTNALFAQKGYPFQPAFLDVLAEHHGTGMYSLDIGADPDGARRAINGWVSHETADRIPDLIPEGEVRRDTRLVLANAMYFKGSWRHPFRTDSTQPADFHDLAGTARRVPTMSTVWSYPFAEGAGYRALALPYVGDTFRMLLIIPNAGQFAAVEGQLSAAFLDSVRGRLQEQRLHVTLPRFEVRQAFSIVEPLRKLGMTDVFTAGADLSGISTEEKLAVTGAQHQAFLAVDEKGTEAAAATAIEMGPVSMPPTFAVDRPFFFVIEEVSTRSVLFLGRIVTL
ncbi:serpin (serine proteinase inhibitor) family protein [Myxococcus stipitatus DSM 14675]|uniref:Serpin (Serine proteinase inhibitor) family protein n=1 Tax=Myxococcus stipitatus (strain DSM 14675 / JCM 12634 / Mx s8) TaxID=1278073 RepID=L7UKT2_MYXSD|nr:serpin family protein [Myxococcus stipitatus]AGC48147.1 serpin (serine proteinase inhibitor) family protein [Myxococcus stipitatus DSM 14675]